MSRRSKKFVGTHNFWSCDEHVPCKRCGAIFHKTHVKKEFCGCKPTKLQITLEQSIVLQKFKNLCRKYRLNVYDTFHNIAHMPGNNFYRLTHPVLQLEMGSQKRALIIKLIDRFNREFEAGCFELIPRQTTFSARRLQTPKEKKCPLTLSHCAGAVLPGSCPRQWRDCPLSEANGLRCA